MRLDQCSKNTKWQDVASLDICQLFEYDMFVEMGHYSRALPAEGYKMIRVHLVFDIKHERQHKACLVADGHLTEVPVDSVYSGVVPLCGLHKCIAGYVDDLALQ